MQKRSLKHEVLFRVNALRLWLQRVVLELVRAFWSDNDQIEEVLVLNRLVPQSLLILIVFAHSIDIVYG